MPSLPPLHRPALSLPSDIPRFDGARTGDGEAVATGRGTFTHAPPRMLGLLLDAPVSTRSAALAAPRSVKRYQGFRLVVYPVAQRPQAGPFAFAVRQGRHTLTTSGPVYRTAEAAEAAAARLVDDALLADAYAVAALAA